MRSHPVMSIDEARAWLAEVMSGTDRLRVETFDGDRVICAAGPDGLERRANGTLSGPALFWAIDLAGFVAVNVLVGPAPAMVLANSSISFLEPAEPGVLRVAAEVIKLASRSAVVDVRASDHRARLVAMATLHFALPSRATRAVALADQAGATT
ncbi:PaaI family thioesterase [Micromonospora sp. RTGN7]|uniref:PaaI family thioesterase n=1 Tax=Micromonospora sp. RTGN7 TaxID=3016526 RepID=UPI0029FEFFA7|nr:PaaI family thioesterase [Micromonospora sp. RTGN7]